MKLTKKEKEQFFIKENWSQAQKDETENRVYENAKARGFKTLSMEDVIKMTAESNAKRNNLRAS